MRRVVWIVVLAAVAAVAFYIWRHQRPADKLIYRSELVDRGDITMTVTATGTLSAVTTVKVGSQVSGIIAKLYADFNSRVSQGQLLAELDPTPFEAQVEQRKADQAQADANVRNTQVSYERQKRLLAEALAAQSDFDSAKAAYESAVAQVAQAKAALEQAQTNLGYTKIVSPVSGVVVDRQYDVGQTVAASFQAPTLFTIAQDLTRMQVQADVDQSDIGRIKVGQVSRFTVDAFPEQEFTGKITQIRLNATVSQNVITYPVIIEVSNPEEKLRPQMTADVTIEVETVRDVVRVANAALRFRPPESALGGKSAAPARDANNGAGRGGEGRPGADRAAGFAANAASRRAGGATRPAGGAPPPGGPNHTAAPRSPHEQTVYVLGAANSLTPVALRTGITDGKFTEVRGGDLKPGDKVVTGSPTGKGVESGRPPGMGRF